MPLIRAFIAVRFPEVAVAEVMRAAAKLHRPLEEAGFKISWVPVHNVHVTLKFLGNLSDAAATDLGAHLRQALAGAAAPRVGLMSLGAFPSATRPRVVYAGVDDPAALAALHARVEAAAAAMGYPAEPRAFQPHLTLGRVRHAGKGARAEELLRSYARERFGEPADLTEVFCYSSQPGSGPPRYVPWERIDLSGRS